jgi:hypothetical protein
MKTPASLYTRSSRYLPQHVPDPQYPSADLFRVDKSGSIRWGELKYFVSSSLARLYVLDNHYAELRFGPFPACAAGGPLQTSSKTQ